MFINCKQYVYIMQTLFISNDKRKKLLRYILANPNEKIEIRKIASKLRVNPGFVSVFVNKLRKERMIRKDALSLDSSYVRSWKILFNIEEINNFIKDILRMIKVAGLGVYGSWSKGTNIENSDIDLWVKVKKQPTDIEIARLRSVIRKKIGIEISLLFITNKRIQEMKENNKPLYFSLVHSFYLWGETID